MDPAALAKMRDGFVRAALLIVLDANELRDGRSRVRAAAHR
jgi:hypothetical protein